MEHGFFPRLVKVTEGQKLQLRKRLLLFSVFLLLSVFIWILNALSKNYNTVIEYPLIYTDFPEDQVFVGELREHLDLQVESHGYALLRYKVFKKPVPISFKVSGFTLHRREGKHSEAYILTRYLKDQISGQLPEELKLIEVEPDTLFFRFAGRMTKRLPLKPGFSFSVDKQFTVMDGVQLDPDSVVVTGPDILLDTLSCVRVGHGDLGELSRNFSDKMRLQRHPDIEYARSKVHCRIELERFTEVQLYVPIEVEHLPGDMNLQTFPSRVKVSCKLGLSKYDRMNEGVFRAVVDYRDIEAQTKVLEVRLLNAPAYLISYQYYPATVEFLQSRVP